MEEVDIIDENLEKKHPSLPPNYVSLAQLKERWLQRKQQEEEEEEEEENHRKKAQDKSLSRGKNPKPNPNPNNGFFRNQTKRKDGMIGIKGRDGFEGGDRMGKKIINEGKSKRFYDKNKGKMSRVEKGQIGEGRDQINGKEVCGRRNWGNDGYDIVGFEEKVSVCMIGVVEEIELESVGLMGESGVKKMGVGKELRGSRSVGEEGSGMVNLVDVMAENEMGKQVSAGGVRGRSGRRCGGKFDKVEEEVLVGKGRSDKGKGNSRRKLRDLGGKKITQVEEEVEKGVEDGVSVNSSDRDHLNKEGNGREIQEYENRKGVSDGLGTRLRRNFEDLSLHDRRERNVTSRTSLHSGHGHSKKHDRFVSRNMYKPVNHNLVWMRKGEMSKINVAGVDISGPSEQES